MQNAELFEPGEYLDQKAPGYFSILSKPSGRAKQATYELQLLPQVVEAANPDIDTWITQATFKVPNRCAVNVRSVGLLFSDLDTYNSPGLKDKPPEEQASLLVGYCQNEGMPAPSIALFSGRGLQPKWLLSEALDPVSLQDWNSAQLALCRLLEPFSADMNAKDISRVLRLDRTTNTKSGEKCRIVYTASGVESVLARYDFQELLENLTDRYPAPKIVPKAPRQNIVSMPHEFTFKKLNWCRLYDIRRLWELRGGVPIGNREMTLFWEINFLLRADPGKASRIWAEAQSLASQIDPGTGWYRNGDLSTVYRKAKESLEGVSVEYNGRTYPPLYTPRNQTLIELFRITADEERFLKTIIGREEKVRRQREKRRAAGMKPRAEYEEQSHEKLKPWVAEGISRAWWYKKRSRL